MRRITDSSAPLPLNPGFNQCLVHPGTSQPQKRHSERDWDRQCLHRACGMCPVVQLFCGDFATQDVAASGVGGIGSKVLWVLRGCTAWEGWGSPTPPSFAISPLQNLPLGRPQVWHSWCSVDIPWQGWEFGNQLGTNHHSHVPTCTCVCLCVCVCGDFKHLIYSIY